MWAQALPHQKAAQIKRVPRGLIKFAEHINSTRELKVEEIFLQHKTNRNLTVG